MVKGFDQSNYQTIQVFYPSKDGTQIPMFIVHKKVSCTLVQHNCHGLLRSLTSDWLCYLLTVESTLLPRMQHHGFF